MHNHPIIIIGAGASGLMAAVAAARMRPRGVLLLEKEARVGRKLLATGNGRCNLLNAGSTEGAYHGSGAAAAQALLRTMPYDALLAQWAALGLTCREEAAGRVYPFSGQAGAVLDVLRAACARLGVDMRTDARVRGICHAAGGYSLSTESGGVLHAARVIVATGGQASPKLGSDGSGYGLLRALGHTVTPLYPAIVPIRTKPEAVRGLKGVRVQGSIALLAGGRAWRREQGELLFTDYGISGVAAMQLAGDVHALAARGEAAELSIRLMDEADAVQRLSRLAVIHAGAPAEGLCTGLLHPRVAMCLLRAAGIGPGTPVSLQVAKRVAPLMSDWRLAVTGTQPFAQAQVTRGGVPLAEFDGHTLESKKAPGLYACGEVLDVDGDCGGFNLMWAWVSGRVAGAAAAGAGAKGAGEGLS